MRILISCLSFSSYTGSELYVYELAKELSKKHDVHILSNIGGDLVQRIEPYGVQCFDIKSPPNYFLGDGITKYQDTLNNTHTTIKGKFYKTSNNYNYDLLILNQTNISKCVLDLYDIPAINIIHSEVLPKFEDPLIHKNVKGYIAIRPEIKKTLIEKWNIKKPIEVIYNPVDTKRFNTNIYYNSYLDSDYILFVGSNDYLRHNAINDLIEYSRKINKKLYLVGRGFENFALEYNHVKTFKPCWDIEKYVKEAYMVASILMGRTVIEGWLCGKTAIIYDINHKGDILSKIKKTPPVDLNKFNAEYVTNNIMKYASSII